MSVLEKDVIRMELQIGQLIRIVANQNDRLNRLEEAEKKEKVIAMQKRSLKERVW